jgi:Flp pilus assembly protein TadG
MSALLRPPRDARATGQALVEFALAVVVFVFLLMAVFDFGRAIFMYNGVSQAAREIARTTSVHPYLSTTATLGQSPETQATITAQRALVPGLETPPTFECVNGSGVAYSAGYQCESGTDYVRVTTRASFRPITPLISWLGDFSLSSSSSIRIPG